jgi:beta-lactamase regulating signal transducer with metallopeptidase domain
MMWPELQTIASGAVTHILNSLPEGLIVAAFAWMMLRFLPRQNSGTRFAVWFVALLSIVGLPFIGSATAVHSFSVSGAARAAITLPGGWGLLLFLIWILAASVAMVRLVNGLWRLRKLRKSCVAIDVAGLDPAIRKTIADFGGLRSAGLAASERVTVPAAIGFFKPMVILPAWALRELPPEELSIILLHEFAHLRRWDDWTNLLQKIVRAVFVFHPAVWWIENRLSLEREMACDDLVLAETANPRGYAKCLIALLEKSFARRGLAMAQAAVHRAQEASLRLARILDAGRPSTRRVWKPALAGVGVFSLLCLGVVARVPQFVAFEQGSQAIHSDAVNSLAVSPSKIPTAAVVPAALHTSSSSSLERAPQLNAGMDPRRVLARHHAIRRVLPALMASAQGSEVRTVAARMNQTVVPTETLLLIRTAQRTGPDSWTCTVWVWRVIWTNPDQERAERAPVPHKT